MRRRQLTWVTARWTLLAAFWLPTQGAPQAGTEEFVYLARCLPRFTAARPKLLSVPPVLWVSGKHGAFRKHHVQHELLAPLWRRGSLPEGAAHTDSPCAAQLASGFVAHLRCPGSTGLSVHEHFLCFMVFSKSLQMLFTRHIPPVPHAAAVTGGKQEENILSLLHATGNEMLTAPAHLGSREQETNPRPSHAPPKQLFPTTLSQETSSRYQV